MRKNRRILRELEKATKSLDLLQELNTGSLVRAFLQVEAGGEPITFLDQDGRILVIDRMYVQDAKKRAEQEEQELMKELGSIPGSHSQETAP